MERYDFVVLKRDEIVKRRHVALRSSKAAWPVIVELTRDVDPAGSRVRVTDRSGRIVILIGVAAARRCPDSTASWWSAMTSPQATEQSMEVATS